MSFLEWFFSFDGRLNRAKWWLAIIILSFLGALLGVVIELLVYLPFSTTVNMKGQTFGLLFNFVMIAILAYPVTAIMVKRLNDRDRPSWIAAVFWAPTVLSLLGQLSGLTFTVREYRGMQIPTMTALGWIIAFAGLVIGIWSLVELGFLRGTAGPNAHGPDPLAR